MLRWKWSSITSSLMAQMLASPSFVNHLWSSVNLLPMLSKNFGWNNGHSSLDTLFVMAEGSVSRFSFVLELSDIFQIPRQRWPHSWWGIEEANSLFFVVIVAEALSRSFNIVCFAHRGFAFNGIDGPMAMPPAMAVSWWPASTAAVMPAATVSLRRATFATRYKNL